MIQLIYIPVESDFNALEVSSRDDNREVEKSPLDPNDRDFDFSQWSKAVKERMNKALQKRGL